MRHVSSQLPLVAPWIAQTHAAELAAINMRLDEQPALSGRGQHDLEAAGARLEAESGNDVLGNVNLETRRVHMDSVCV